MAAFAILCHVLLLVLNVAALPHRRLLPQLRRGWLLHDDATTILMVLGASAIFHATVAGPNPNDDTEAINLVAAAGFLIWVAGVALLLTPGRFAGAAAAPARFAAQLVQAAIGGWF